MAARRSWVFDHLTIQWTAGGFSGKVRIELSRDGGATWTVLFSNTTNDGAQGWKVSGPPTTQARVRVSSLTNGAMTDASDFDFTIGG